MSATLREQLAAYFHGTRGSCGRKVAYRSRARAQLAAERRMRVVDEKLFVYRCSYCHEWHLTRMEQDEMSLMTRAHLLDKYGMRLTLEQLADVLGTTLQVIYNRMSRGEFPIPTYMDGARRYASYEAVAQYFDDLHERAKQELEREKKPESETRV